MTRQMRYQIKHREDKLCRWCPAKATHGVFCRPHYQQNKEARRRRQGVQKHYKERFP